VNIFLETMSETRTIKQYILHPVGISNLGPVILFFGCRLKTLDLYREEKQKMVDEHVLDEVHLALSREPGTPKVGTFILRQNGTLNRSIITV
jgi:nitric-oxide synthase